MQPTGTLYRLEPRQTCPAFDLSDGVNRLSIAGEARQWGDKTPADLLRLKAASGICLIESPATLAEADAVLVSGQVHKGKSAFAAGLDPYADTVRAERLSFYLRDNGALQERYRSTGVTYSPLLPLLLPSYVSGYGLEMKPGFLRSTAYRGDAKHYHPAPPLEPFLEKSLHFDLALGDGERRRDARYHHHRPRPAGPDRPRQGQSHGRLFPKHQSPQGRRDLPTPSSPRASSKTGGCRCRATRPRRFANSPATTRHLPPVSPARFLAGCSRFRPANAKTRPAYLGYPIGYLASAIAALPDAAILPYRAELERLAHDPEARINAYVALKKLSAFGADGVPTLIYLIDDAANHRDKNKVRNAWQHPYLAGVQGLCLTGTEASAAIPLLYERLDDGTMVKFGSYWSLAINTLVSLGAEPDDMWPHLQTADKNHTRERFDGKVSNARKKLVCSY